MSHQNIPPPPQYPNHNNDMNDHIIKDNSIMENSVVYISDNGSPNYKSTSKNDYYQHHQSNQIIPNLVNSLNSTYQNLPPKSPKSNYRHIINQNEFQTSKVNPNTFQFKANSNYPQVNSNEANFLYKNPPKMNQNNSWFIKNKDDWERDVSKYNENVNPQMQRQQPNGSKTRSHPNLMNDYVNLSGADHLLSEIMGGMHRKTTGPISNALLTKHQNQNPTTTTTSTMANAQNSTSTGALFGPSNPEIYRGVQGMYPYSLAANSVSGISTSVNATPTSNVTSFIPDQFPKDPDNFNSESSRLVNLLLEENKRLRSKLRQSDTRVEVIDQLERKIHNLEILFEELLTSQRRQRLLDLQLQQASLSTYLSRNVISNQDISSPAINSTTNLHPPSNNNMFNNNNTIQQPKSLFPPIISSSSNQTNNNSTTISNDTSPVCTNESSTKSPILSSASPQVSTKIAIPPESPGDYSVSSSNKQVKIDPSKRMIPSEATSQSDTLSLLTTATTTTNDTTIPTNSTIDTNDEVIITVSNNKQKVYAESDTNDCTKSPIQTPVILDSRLSTPNNHASQQRSIVKTNGYHNNGDQQQQMYTVMSTQHLPNSTSPLFHHHHYQQQQPQQPNALLYHMTPNNFRIARQPMMLTSGGGGGGGGGGTATQIAPSSSSAASLPSSPIFYSQHNTQPQHPFYPHHHLHHYHPYTYNSRHLQQQQQQQQILATTTPIPTTMNNSVLLNSPNNHLNHRFNMTNTHTSNSNNNNDLFQPVNSSSRLEMS